ncbi:unnamed protein product [Amoebophrya sp. A25]|nr:unnamed protein product [Amoebophrya sp. A25]|eukprot:GSA25T00014388001.1
MSANTRKNHGTALSREHDVTESFRVKWQESQHRRQRRCDKVARGRRHNISVRSMRRRRMGAAPQVHQYSPPCLPPTSTTRGRCCCRGLAGTALTLLQILQSHQGVSATSGGEDYVEVQSNGRRRQQDHRGSTSSRNYGRAGSNSRRSASSTSRNDFLETVPDESWSADDTVVLTERAHGAFSLLSDDVGVAPDHYSRQHKRSRRSMSDDSGFLQENAEDELLSVSSTPAASTSSTGTRWSTSTGSGFDADMGRQKSGFVQERALEDQDEHITTPSRETPGGTGSSHSSTSSSSGPSTSNIEQQASTPAVRGRKRSSSRSTRTKNSGFLMLDEEEFDSRLLGTDISSQDEVADFATHPPLAARHDSSTKTGTRDGTLLQVSTARTPDSYGTYHGTHSPGRRRDSISGEAQEAAAGAHGAHDSGRSERKSVPYELQQRLTEGEKRELKEKLKSRKRWELQRKKTVEWAEYVKKWTEREIQHGISDEVADVLGIDPYDKRVYVLNMDMYDSLITRLVNGVILVIISLLLLISLCVRFFENADLEESSSDSSDDEVADNRQSPRRKMTVQSFGGR